MCPKRKIIYNKSKRVGLKIPIEKRKVLEDESIKCFRRRRRSFGRNLVANIIWIRTYVSNILEAQNVTLVTRKLISQYSGKQPTEQKAKLRQLL